MLTARTAPAFGKGRFDTALLIATGAGFLLLLAPTVFDLYTQFWRGDSNNQGPLMLAMSVWLFWHSLNRADIRAKLVLAGGNPAAGFSWLAVGLLLYTLGRSQSVLAIETFALVPVLLGIFVLLWGGAVARETWFCFVFLLFCVPLPSVLVDTVTQPLKIVVSYAATEVLHSLGYVVAREGVVIHMGPYQLMVADACAGLYSLFSLEAMGLLYLNVVRHESAWRNGVMAVLILPISVTSNTLRVVALALITYYLGEAAGQGFLHTFAGLLLFMLALVLMMATDTLLRLGFKVLGR